MNSGQSVACSVYCGWPCGCMLEVQHGGRLLLLSPHSPLMSHAGLMIAHYTAAALGEFPLNYGQCLALYLHKGIYVKWQWKSQQNKDSM